MYKVLIVDDEDIIRRGLQVIIDWKKLGVDEIYTAASGEQAAELLEKVPVDFMLTDICMVNMSGLELIEKVNRSDTDMRIVVLTGYDSFEYARQCCRMEVHDFLLKPIDRESLETAVKKQLEILRKSREEKSRKQIEYRAEGQERSWKAGYEYQYLLAKNICISLYDVSGQGLTFEDSLGRIVVGMFCGEQYDEVEERVRALKTILYEETGCSVNILIGNRVEGLQYLRASYQDAVSIIPQIKEKHSAIYLTPKSEQRLKIFRETVAELQRIMEEKIDDLEVLLKTYDTYIRCTKSYNLSESMMRRTLYRLLSALYYEYRIDRGEKEDNYINQLIDSLTKCNNEEMAVVGRECILHLFNREKENVHDVVRTAKEYIKEHLSEELSLDILARQSYISPVYFSRLFKQETGEGVSEYIVRKRMEQAKSLLASTMLRSGEIAYKSGYRDVNYFSAAFKKNVGMSPREYRDSVRKGKGI